MIYHYYAFMYTAPGVRVDIDGIVSLREPVVDMKSYKYVKSLIAASCDKDGNGIDIEKLTIASLSVLR